MFGLWALSIYLCLKSFHFLFIQNIYLLFIYSKHLFIGILHVYIEVVRNMCISLHYIIIVTNEQACNVTIGNNTEYSNLLNEVLFYKWAAEQFW